MKFNLSNPDGVSRDHLVFSPEHCCKLQYAFFYLFAYDSVTVGDIKQFCQLEYCTPGYTANFVTKDVEVTTGPPGQDICYAISITKAEAHVVATYDKQESCALDDGFYP